MSEEKQVGAGQVSGVRERAWSVAKRFMASDHSAPESRTAGDTDALYRMIVEEFASPQSDALAKLDEIIAWASSKTPCASHYDCLLGDLKGLRAELAPLPQPVSGLRELIAKWRENFQPYEPCDQIYYYVAEQVMQCADELEAALSLPSSPVQPPTCVVETCSMPNSCKEFGYCLAQAAGVRAPSAGNVSAPVGEPREELWKVIKRLYERFHHGSFTNWPAIANRLNVWLAAPGEKTADSGSQGTQVELTAEQAEKIDEIISRHKTDEFNSFLAADDLSDYLFGGVNYPGIFAALAALAEKPALGSGQELREALEKIIEHCKFTSGWAVKDEIRKVAEAALALPPAPKPAPPAEVWVVLKRDYEDREPLCAFTSETEAEAEVIKLREADKDPVPFGYMAVNVALRRASLESEGK